MNNCSMGKWGSRVSNDFLVRTRVGLGIVGEGSGFVWLLAGLLVLGLGRPPCTLIPLRRREFFLAREIEDGAPDIQY